MIRASGRFYLMAFHFAVLIALAGSSNAVLAGAPPRITFDPPEPSFGTITINDGRDRSLSVRVRNHSANPITLQRIEIGCGCMDALCDGPRTVGPNEESSIAVRLRVQRMQRGPVSYRLTVFDEKGIAGTAAVAYSYEPAVFASPPALVLANSTEDGGVFGTGLVHAREDLSTQHFRVETSESFLIATLQERSNPKDPFVLNVALHSSQSGPFEGIVSLYFKGSNELALVVPVRATVSPPVVVKPDAILIRGASAPVNRKVTLHNAGAYALTGIEVSSPHIEVTQRLDRWNTPVELEVRVSAAAADATGLVDQRIKLLFDGPRRFEMFIPVVGEIR